MGSGTKSLNPRIFKLSVLVRDNCTGSRKVIGNIQANVENLLPDAGFREAVKALWLRYSGDSCGDRLDYVHVGEINRGISALAL